ncbi:unnamed protein product [Ectocarpus sp. 6 AP-2014]
MFSPRVFFPGEGRSTRVTDMGKEKKRNVRYEDNRATRDRSQHLARETRP